MSLSASELPGLAQRQGAEFIALQFVDILGKVKQVAIPASELPSALEHGVWFDGSSIEGLARVVIAENDKYLRPDVSTYALVPWDVEAGVPTARLICDVHSLDGKPFPGDPRHVLRRALEAAAKLGFAYNIGPEVEFFLFQRTAGGAPSLVPHDTAGYFDSSTDQAGHIRRRIVRALAAFGVSVEGAHHEVAPGQHEIDFHYGPALQTADHIVTFRSVVKAVAQQHGLYATMMPKPLAGFDGSGLHLHLSLSDPKSGKNLFYAAADPYNLTPVARHFIAGLLAHARGMAAILAPLVNSYKRLVPGYEAPVYLTWGRTNRSALVRVPRAHPRRPETTRVELRCPDPSCNPYLAFAVVLAAGLDGIRRELPLPDAAEEDLYTLDPRAQQHQTLPRTLGEAIDELQRDEVVAAALGPQVMERFVEAKRQEWENYRAHVSQWEIDRYLDQY